MAKHLKLTLIRSLIGRSKNHKACIQGLGLKRIHQQVTIEDNPCNRGMINHVSYLLKVEESK